MKERRVGGHAMASGIHQVLWAASPGVRLCEAGRKFKGFGKQSSAFEALWSYGQETRNGISSHL
jgi:hypothetical protein